MFVIRKEDRFTWPVTVKVPTDDGKHLVQKFTAVFRVLPQTRQNEIMRETVAADVDIARDVLVGWSGIVDEAKAEIAYSDEMRDVLIDIPYFRKAVVETYLAAIDGRGARVKN